jgi:ABC-type nitrate/sulfonate/bicarbonate transport system substrate-binding protein
VAIFFEVKMKYLTTFTLLCALLFGSLACGPKQADTLRMGIIGPSINHLPLSFALDTGQTDSEAYKMISFSSGWEVQEALIAGKIDAAIIPFSYAWNAAARGYPVKIVSFLERESDAIVSSSSVIDLKDLHTRKIGLLKASTVELLMIDLAESAGIDFSPVYFRTPNELVAALQARQVDAIVAYVPVIQQITGDFHVLHWFGESHPQHPCCDIAVNQKQLNPAKTLILKQLIETMHCVLPDIDAHDPQLLGFAKDTFRLNDMQVAEALNHTKFRTGLDEEGKALQRRLMTIAVRKGYQKTMIGDDSIYLELP